MKKVNHKILILLVLLTFLFSFTLSASATTVVQIEGYDPYENHFLYNNYYSYRNYGGEEVNYYTWFKVYPEMWEDVIKLAARKEGVAVLFGYQADDMANKKIQYVTTNNMSGTSKDFYSQSKILWRGSSDRASYYDWQYTNTYTNLLYTDSDINQNSNVFVSRNMLPSGILHACSETDMNPSSNWFYLERVSSDGDKRILGWNTGANGQPDTQVTKYFTSPSSTNPAYFIDNHTNIHFATVNESGDPRYIMWGWNWTSFAGGVKIYEKKGKYKSESTYSKSTESYNYMFSTTYGVFTMPSFQNGGFMSYANVLYANTSPQQALSSSVTSSTRPSEYLFYNLDANKLPDEVPRYNYSTGNEICNQFIMWVGFKGVLTDTLMERGDTTALHGDTVVKNGTTTRYIDESSKNGTTYLDSTASEKTITKDIVVKTPTSQEDVSDSILSIEKQSVVYVPADKTITIEEGAALIVASGSTLILSGTIENYGTILVQPGGQIITMQLVDNMRSAIFNMGGSLVVVRDGGMIAVKRFAAGVNRGSYRIGDAENSAFYKALDDVNSEARVVVSGLVCAHEEMALVDGTEVIINGGKILYGDLQDSIYPYLIGLDSHDITDKDFTSKVIIGKRYDTSRCYVTNAVYTLENGGEIITSK